MLKTTDQHIAAAMAAVGTELNPEAPVRQLLCAMFPRTLRWMALLMDEAASDEVQQLLHELNRERTSSLFEPSPDDYFSVWTSYLHDRVNDLFRYAESGAGWYITDAGSQCLDDHLADLEALFLNFPVTWLESDDETKTYHQTWLLIGKARARHRLDSGQDLTFKDVVLLSGMNEKSVSNATQKRHGSKRLKIKADNTVKHADALAWLLDRKSFIPTIGASYETQYQAGLDAKDIVFVPISESGCEFLPSSGSGYGQNIYQISDDHGEIHYFSDYFEALEKLMVWEHGAWVDKEGWQTVDPQCWVRKTKTDLLRDEKSATEAAEQRLKEARFC